MLIPGSDSGPVGDNPIHIVSQAHAAPLSGIQANRASTRDCRAFLAVCTDAQPVPGAAACTAV